MRFEFVRRVVRPVLTLQRGGVAMTIIIGSIWIGTQVHHKWVVRVHKTMQQHVLVEVIAGPSNQLKTLKKFSTAHFLRAYTPRSSPETKP